MTGVRWTRAEAEQAAADALRRSNAPIATNALTDARAVLDALGLTDTVTITAAPVARDHACCKANMPPLSITRWCGAEYECPSCGGRWIWDDDEAEGGAWYWDPENDREDSA